MYPKEPNNIGLGYSMADTSGDLAVTKSTGLPVRERTAAQKDQSLVEDPVEQEENRAVSV